MPKRSSKRTRKPAKDANEAAADIVRYIAGEGPKPEPPPAKPKNPAAVALGRLGGLKGGKARAKSLSARKRSEIARAAATARWAPNDKTG